MQLKSKHLFLALTSIMLLLGNTAIAEVVATDTLKYNPTHTDDTLGIHPWRYFEPVAPEIAHWSLWVEGGFNIFDGDFYSEMSHPVYAPSLGIGVEYNFNCTWGIGLEYHFDDYRVTGSADKNMEDVLFKGISHRADAFVTFDIFNAWRPQNQFKLFALNLFLGGGPVWYQNWLYWGDEVPYGEKHTQLHKDRKDNLEQHSDDDYRAAAVFLGGAAFEFNVNRSIQLGLRATYSYFTKDNIDMRNTGNNNDGIFDMDFILRWKIEGRKKSHVRNMASTDIVKTRNNDDNKCCDHIKDTLVIYSYTYDTLYVFDTVRTEVDDETDYYYVYFANDDATIDGTGQKRILEVAEILRRDSNLCVEVSAFCDNTGSGLYNQTLSDRRAKNVVAELIQEYEIAPERVQFISNGIQRRKNQQAQGSYAPNRRAEMHIVKKDIFEKKYMTSNNRRVMSTVRVPESQTLRQLGQKYYNNPSCWFYIYQENSDKISDPDDIPVGTFLKLPVLNDKEKSITDSEANKKFENIVATTSILEESVNTQQKKEELERKAAELEQKLKEEADKLSNKTDSIVQKVVEGVENVVDKLKKK